MRQFGIVARIALIVTVALVVGQFAVMISYVWQAGRSATPPYAIADRVAAVVRLLDEMPANLRDEAVAVANVNGFEVSISPSVPPTFQDKLRYGRMRVMAQAMIDAHASDRTVRVGTLGEPVAGEDESIITFVTELKTGEVAVFTISDDTTLRLWNVPIGFVAGLVGIAIALLAVLAVARETRPLVQLAQSIDELGTRIEPVQVKERGAKELRTLIRAINDMQARILGLVNNRTLFLGAISHDLKTYLTRFRLRLEMMPSGGHRDKAIRDVDAMQQLLNDVLLFASDTSAHSEPEAVDLNGALRRCAGDAAAAGVRIDLKSGSDAMYVLVPPAALARVIDNLISNALRYGEAARITSERRGPHACFVIEDNGPGIRQEDMASVFDPFFRAEPSRNRTHGGTGLGLSIVKQILDAHGGTIDLENIRPAGLRATVCLPLASPPDSPPMVAD